MSSETVEIFVELVNQGTDAMLVTDGDSTAWIPYTQIQSGSELTSESEKGDEGDLAIPEWLAKDRNLV